MTQLTLDEVPTAAPTAVKVIGLPVSAPEAAVTTFVPTAAPSVNVVEARPLLFVATDAAVSAPAPAVTVKVTVVPETGVPLASVT